MSSTSAAPPKTQSQAERGGGVSNGAGGTQGAGTFSFIEINLPYFKTWPGICKILELKLSPRRPKGFFRYVDDTFVIWQHGWEKLSDFLDNFNSRDSNIIFTMEIKEDGCLPFLDILLRRKAYGMLSHGV
ncbi:hypothetical protein J437_LFUL015250 [Ladona fulva]|uniref:Uncharacterized protein n=1 Tax=Ladona fulva TaxID=123851 RepID=A0A8K0KPD3_LADFU|nr:hypothetical protein J437_LFUL015250 [Ladona fulva]